MSTNVYRVELLIIDFDDVGGSDIKDMIESARYPNHCISPDVKKMEVRCVEWSDDHPLNHRDKCDAAYADLFAKDQP